MSYILKSELPKLFEEREMPSVNDENYWDFLVNADVNGACNIIKKAVPNAFINLKADGIEGVVGHPRPICMKG